MAPARSPSAAGTTRTRWPPGRHSTSSRKRASGSNSASAARAIPPPSTTTSGSTALTMEATPQARRRTDSSQTAVAWASPRRWASTSSRVSWKRPPERSATVQLPIAPSRLPGMPVTSGGPSGSRQRWPRWPPRPAGHGRDRPAVRSGQPGSGQADPFRKAARAPLELAHDLPRGVRPPALVVKGLAGGGREDLAVLGRRHRLDVRAAQVYADSVVQAGGLPMVETAQIIYFFPRVDAGARDGNASR